jgi:leukotriene-A4 hydrolase
VCSDVFEPFFRKYIETHKYKTATTDEWKAFLMDYFKDKVRLFMVMNANTLNTWI